MVRTIEQTKTGAQDRPAKDVVIKESGTLPVEKPFAVEKTDATD